MDLTKLMINGVSFAVYAKTQELCSMNLIVGANSVGKTRLLKAMTDVCRYSLINEHSFDCGDLEDFIETWKKISTKHPLVRGAILALLRKVEPDFYDFENNDNPDQLFVELVSTKESVDIYNMGSGFKRIFEIAVRAWEIKDGVILIDDVELGLHWSVQAPLWAYLIQVAKERNNRIFATTHSGDAITAFAKTTSSDGDIRGLLIRLGYSDRLSDKGALITTTFDEQELINLHAMGIDARG